MSLPLSEYNSKSKCEKRQPIIVSGEKSKKHIAINNDKNLVRQFKIDNDVIKDNIKKCDYLVLNDDKQTAYFVELKGTDVDGAILQIENMIKKFGERLERNSYEIKRRIVFSGTV